jgi:hypothetical protein
MNDPWEMRIDGALSAHFFQPDGSSQPGTDWSVALRRGNDQHRVLVRSYLAGNATRRVRADTTYQGRTVMQYLGDLLAQGWTPDQASPGSITIGNPDGEPPDQPHKAWWKIW